MNLRIVILTTNFNMTLGKQWFNLNDHDKDILAPFFASADKWQEIKYLRINEWYAPIFNAELYQNKLYSIYVWARKDESSFRLFNIRATQALSLNKTL
mgnify:CR=1 FL=1